MSIKFFDVKLKLFGKDKLIKDITLNDLDDDDKATLRNGSLQVRQSDVTSTTIVAELFGLRSFKKIENELRARYYLLMSVLTSKEVVHGQGVVIVANTIGSFKDKLNGRGITDHAKLLVATVQALILPKERMGSQVWLYQLEASNPKKK
jgi:hypothetical protein